MGSIKPERLEELRGQVRENRASGATRNLCLENLRQAEAAFDSAKTTADIKTALQLVALWREYCGRGDIVPDTSFCYNMLEQVQQQLRQRQKHYQENPKSLRAKAEVESHQREVDWWAARCAEARLPDKEYCDRKLAQAQERLANWKSWEGKKKQQQYAKEVKEWAALCSKPDTWFDPWAYQDPETPGPSSPPYDYEDYRPPAKARRPRKAAVAVKAAPVLQLPPPEPPPTRRRRGRAGKTAGGKGGGALPSITLQR